MEYIQSTIMSIYWTHTILQASEIFHVSNETTIYYQYLFFTIFFFIVGTIFSMFD